MKIYQHEPLLLIRLQITKQGEQTEYLTLHETNAKEVEDFVKCTIEAQNISPFVGGKVTSVNIREAKGGKNGKSKSISFKGKTPKETLNLIIQNIK